MTLRTEFQNFIDGTFKAGSEGKTFPTVAPATGEAYGVVHEASRADVDAAVAAAKAALKGPWGKLTIPERTQLLTAVADEIDRRFDEFLEAEITDTGKTRC